MTRLFRCLPSLLLLAGACSPTDTGDPQPVDVLRFPADVALSSDGTTLYVVGTNFDLEYNSGVLHTVDVQRLSELTDQVPEGEVGRFDVPWMGRGGVRIGSFGGRPAVAELPEGGDRVFVPLRGGRAEAAEGAGEGGAVAVADVVGGEATCTGGDAVDCRPTQVELVTELGFTLADPYSSVVVGPDVYVGTLGFSEIPEGGSRFFMARLPVAAPQQAEVRSAGTVSMRVLAQVPGREDLVQGGDLRAIATTGAQIQAGIVRLLPRAAFGVEAEVESSQLSLQADLGANQVYDLAFEEGGDHLWVVSRAPSALVTYRWSGAEPLAEADYLGAASLPGGAARVVVLGEPGRPLLATTSVASGALSFVDPLRQEVVAVLDGSGCVDPSAPCPSGSRQVGFRDEATDPGVGPLGLVALPAEEGARLVVADFELSRLVVVDVPDLGRPEGARVRAVFSSEEMQP